MKKLLLSLFCILSFATLQAQYTSGHISVSLAKSASHDSTNCLVYFTNTYIITIDSSYIGEVMNLIDTFSATLAYTAINTTGVSPWTVTVPSSGSVDGDADYAYLGPGPHTLYYYSNTYKVICGLDTLKDLATADTLVTNLCNYGFVSGRVYIDNNSDCIFDSGDVGLNAPQISIAENVSSGYGPELYSVGYAYTTGAYYYWVQQSWMINYSVSVPSSYAFIFPASSCFTTSYTFDTLSDTGVNFPLQCSGNVDVQSGLLSPGRVRLHTPLYIQPYVGNTGCDSESGELTLVLDPYVTYDASMSSYPADIVHGDTLIWNYYNLTSLSAGAYWNSFLSNVYLSLNSTVVVGDTLCFRVYSTIPAADINPANNDYTICLPVVYSYDPNEKDVTPMGTGTQGYIQANEDTLTYDLHFQNTGSDLADNIVVIDTLDPNINASTLKILGTSNNMTPAWLTPNVVQFNFDNIYLPDSSDNEAASHGDVRFSVALNKGLAPGTQIKNTGYIYFDLNPAIVTNTTVNTIAKPSKVEQITQNAIVKIYPNPATDHIYAENLGGGELIIMNLNGATVIDEHITSNLATIDVSALPAAVYMLKTVSNQTTTTTKFIKY